MNRFFRNLSVTTALFGMAAIGASAQVLFDSKSFEATGGPPNWVVGSIVPQNGWVGFSADDGANNPITLQTILGTQTITPATGLQMQRIKGNASPTRNSYVWVDLATKYSTRTSGNNSISMLTDILLPSSEGDTGVRPQGLEAYDPAGNFIGGFNVINQDQSFGFGASGTLSDDQGTYGGFTYIGLLPRDEWIRVETILDYDNNLMEIYLNKVQLTFFLNDNTFHVGWPLFGGSARDFNDADLVSYGADGATATSLFTDNYKVSAMRSVTFNGSVALTDNAVSDAVEPVFLAFELRNANGTVRSGLMPVRIAEADGTTPAIGDYSVRFHDVPNGTYQLCIKGDKHLSKAINVTVAGGVVSVPQVTLLGGDANGDDIVDVLDLSAIISAFDSVLDEDPNTAGNQPSTNWDSFADFNYDGFVDVLDLAVLISNFDQNGDCFTP